MENEQGKVQEQVNGNGNGNGNSITIDHPPMNRFYENLMPFGKLKDLLLKERPTNSGMEVTKYRIRGKIVQQRIKFPNGEEHWINYKLLNDVLKEVQ